MADFLNGIFDHSTPNVFGGEDLYGSDGSLLGRTVENVHGGVDIYDENHQRTGYTMDNVFGGHDEFDTTGQRTHSTMAQARGGMSVHDHTGRQEGVVHDHGDGVTFQTMDGHLSTFRQNLTGGVSADPLTNMRAIHFPSILG